MWLCFPSKNRLQMRNWDSSSQSIVIICLFCECWWLDGVKSLYGEVLYSDSISFSEKWEQPSVLRGWREEGHHLSESPWENRVHHTWVEIDLTGPLTTSGAMQLGPVLPAVLGFPWDFLSFAPQTFLVLAWLSLYVLQPNEPSEMMEGKPHRLGMLRWVVHSTNLCQWLV